jgi:hypothetical protein
MPSVPYTEKAFLQLMARRLLRYQRDAEARGEVYHDVSPFRFEVAPGGYIPVVLFKRWAQFQPIELQEIAESVLDAPAKLRTSADSVLEYVRATDATT